MFEYSTLGYAILGLVIKRASGVSYQEYITTNIFLPLRMSDTVFEIDSVPRKELALGYRWEENQWKLEPMLHDGSFGAMGGLITTIDDFVTYAQFHMSAWPPSDAPETGPISRKSLREMHQPLSFVDVVKHMKTPSSPEPVAVTETNPGVAGYGFGLAVTEDASQTKVVRHAGGLPGFGSEWR